MSEKKKERLDKEITNRFILSRNEARKLLEQGLVTVNNKVVTKASYLVAEEDIIFAPEVIKEEKNVFASIKRSDFENPIHDKIGSKEVIVVFENEDIIVIIKGKGVLSHSSETKSNSPDVSSSLQHAGYSLGGGPSDRMGIVHRLDEDTKGLMIVTKNTEAFELIKESLKNREIVRKYLGLCDGCTKQEHFTIRGNLLNDFKNKKVIVSPNGKNAVTIVTNIENFSEKNKSINEFKLETGRTHQIRVHMAKVGHPIIGDKKYGKKSNDEMQLFSYFLKFEFKAHQYKFIWCPSFTISDRTYCNIIQSTSNEFINKNNIK